MTRIAGAVLAAGAGSRMGRPKAEVVADGRRLLDRAVDALRDGGCDPVLAVVRPGTEVIGATAVINPEPERGQRSSLALAVDAAAAAGADALLLMLVDLPGVEADAVRAVAGAWRPGRITRGTYAGAGAAHPLVMGMHSWFRALEVADADGGARPYLRANPRLIDDVAVDGDPRDLDTPDDLERWHRR
ncbi:MAG: nucleotidyltransferase family protein [Jatrophihabitans sp.]|uniref:nucleotidyltransferase family protein n=1 Tax=Jatrophihabitans sp. TaxID=1932789 RepID=UPI003F7D0404